jgi:hypothetical protein
MPLMVMSAKAAVFGKATATVAMMVAIAATETDPLIELSVGGAAITVLERTEDDDDCILLDTMIHFPQRGRD